MTTRSGGNDANRRSVVILDPDDGSPVIVIMPEQAAPAADDKALPADRASAPPSEKK